MVLSSATAAINTANRSVRPHIKKMNAQRFATQEILHPETTSVYHSLRRLYFVHVLGRGGLGVTAIRCPANPTRVSAEHLRLG